MYDTFFINLHFHCKFCKFAKYFPHLLPTKRNFKLLILNLSISKCFKENFADTAQISNKIPSQYRVFVHGDRQKYTLHLKTNFDVFIFRPFWHFITKCYRYYYKMRHLFYYKMRQKFITKCVNVFITECDSLLQDAAVCTKWDFYY